MTWQPSITPGGATDDAYNFPGSTKLDGTFDSTGNPSLVKTGSVAGWVLPNNPTIAELNASSDWNQIVGLYNRRATRFNTQFGTTIPIFAYRVVTSRVGLRATDYNTFTGDINTLRAFEGFTPYTFPVKSAGQQRLGSDMAHCRKALGIYGPLAIKIDTSEPIASTWYTRSDNPYNTHVSEALSNPGSGQFVGKSAVFGGTITRWRFMWRFRVPDWMPTLLTANLAYVLSGGVQVEALTLDTYSNNINSPILTPAYAGSFYTGNTNLENSIFPVVAGSSSMALTLANIVASAGGYYSLLTVGNLEFSNGGAALASNVIWTPADAITVTF